MSQIPNTGELKRRVTIKKWTDSANAGFGIDQVVDTGVIRWAKIEPVMGVAYWGTKQIAEEITHRIWLRYNALTKPLIIDNQHVVDYVAGNARYRVVKATNVDDSEKFTLLECKELGVII